MDEFMNMIYKNWSSENDMDCSEEAAAFRKVLEKGKGIVSDSFLEDITLVYSTAFETSRNKAFIAGFAYAAKCISNGKIELSN